MRPVKVEKAGPIYLPADRAAGSGPATSQVFPVLVLAFPSVTRKHFVVCAYSPLLDQSQRESVASQLCAGGATALCDFIVHDAEGEATVVTDIGEDGAAAFESAAAVAVVKARCGWDESRPIIVRVNNAELSVVAQFDGGEWVASVSKAG